MRISNCFNNLAFRFFGGVISLFAISQSAIASGGASGNIFDWSEAAPSEFGGTGASIKALIKLGYFVIYLIAGALLASAGFKMSQGDMPGFFKMVGGGSFMFIVPRFAGELVVESAKGNGGS